MDAVDSTGLVIPVSVWIKHLETTDVAGDAAATSSQRSVVVMEPVDRTTATLCFNHQVLEHTLQSYNRWVPRRLAGAQSVSYVTLCLFSLMFRVQ